MLAAKFLSVWQFLWVNDRNQVKITQGFAISFKLYHQNNVHLFEQL